MYKVCNRTHICPIVQHAQFLQCFKAFNQCLLVRTQEFFAKHLAPESIPCALWTFRWSPWYCTRRSLFTCALYIIVNKERSVWTAHLLDMMSPTHPINIVTRILLTKYQTHMQINNCILAVPPYIIQLYVESQIKLLRLNQNPNVFGKSTRNVIILNSKIIWEIFLADQMHKRHKTENTIVDPKIQGVSG